MQYGWGAWVVSTVLLASAAAGACGGGDDPAVVSNPTPIIEAGLDTSTPPTTSLCPSGTAVDWPPGPYAIELTSTLPPDLVFNSPTGALRLKDYFEPCAAKSRLLVIRTSAAWCGSCIWHATHTKRLVDDPRFTGRLVLVDLLVADEDNMPPNAAAAARWQAKIDMPTRLAFDAKFTFAPVLLAKSPLPEYVFVDTRTMRVRTVAADPSPEGLQSKVSIELAALDGAPKPDEVSPRVYDNAFTDNQIDLLREMKLPSAPPPDPTNELADVPAAATFGKLLFADAQLSPAGVACSKCHASALAFADGLPQAIGVAKVDRNSPSIALAAHARWQFWDGRADTLWMQALGPPENSKEMASTRLYIAHQVATRYAATYGAVFGAKYPLPDISDAARFPANGKPGDASYDAMTQADRDAITRIYVNVGKSIAAYERTLRVKPNALDRYAAGDTSALTAPQKTALQQFFTGGCVQCHWGPRMTDDAFHVIRVPTGRQDGKPDRGRIDVLAGLATLEFVATTKWSDSPGAAKLLKLDPLPSMLGAFKTPPLRGLVGSAPFGHGGSFATLLDVSKHYGTRAEAVKDDRTVGTIEEWVPLFDTIVQTSLPAFLEVLTAEVENP